VSNESPHERELLSPILRPEVFNNPGGVEWLRASEPPRQLQGWVTICGCSFAMTCFVVTLLFVAHSQTLTYSGWTVDGQLDCGIGSNSCSIRVRGSSGGATYQAILSTGATVTMIDAQGHKVPCRILAGNNSDNTILLTCMRGILIPAQGLSIQAIETRSLLGWILPRNPFVGATP
jgi:hypothetical protein